MLFANITSYVGQCSDAEHYYCKYHIAVPGTKISKQYNGSNFSDDELIRTINSQSEVDFINIKDNGDSLHNRYMYKIGMETNRFNSIEQIHETLISKFGDQTIITYNESDIFKDMLYYVDGKNMTYTMFDDIWNYVPVSCYKDLLPDYDTIIIKCDDCGHEYKMDEVSTERELSIEKRTLVKFNRKRDMDEPCCSHFDLKWNIIL